MARAGWSKLIPRNFARRIMGLDREGAGERWLAHLPDQVETRIREIVEPLPAEAPAGKRGRAPDSLTYAHTARRSFEVAYWKTIASLAETPLLNKNNADCVLDEATQRMLPYRDRHLDRLGDLLLAYHREEDRGRENDRQGAGGRRAVPLAHRHGLLVDGRLAEEPGRRGRAQPARS